MLAVSYRRIAMTIETASKVPQAAWVHQIYATGGGIGSITMVMVFGRSLCFLCVFYL